MGNEVLAGPNALSFSNRLYSPFVFPHFPSRLTQTNVHSLQTMVLAVPAFCKVRWLAAVRVWHNGWRKGKSMGLVKTRRLAAMHPPSHVASTFAEATVDEPTGKEAAARDPPSQTASAKATADESVDRKAVARILLRQGHGGLKAGMRPPCKDRKVPVPRAKFSSDPRRP